MTSDPMGALAPRYASDAGLGAVAMHPKGSADEPRVGRVRRGGGEAVGV